MLLKTPMAAVEIGTSPYRLQSLIRGGKLTPPQKDSSGDYLWGPEDLDRARAAIAKVDGRFGKKNQLQGCTT